MSTNSIPEKGERQLFNDEVPKAWQSGEPYKFSPPVHEGDPWQNLLTPMLEKDKAQCQAWKDEVQNLLIFAGLFSAVVTTFIIETYKGLQQDPSDTMILLLSKISNNLQNPYNSSAELISTSLPPFSPTPSILRVNIFLFISLILSLAAVLIGIVSLQWLREHQAYDSSFTPQNSFASFCMRSKALEKWRVPEIFSVLPLILQSALILFFIGIIDFLLSIDVHVAIPVASVIGLTLLFFLFTTMLPTLQGFILHHPNLKLNNEVPVQCPYKSPQSNAFRRLITSSELVFVAASLSTAIIYWTIMHLYLLPGQILDTNFSRSIRGKLPKNIKLWPSYPLPFTSLKLNLKPWHDFDYMIPYIHQRWSFKSSFHFELAWLSIRDHYYQSTCDQDTWLYINRDKNMEQAALYDGIFGLREELEKEDVNVHSNFERSIFMVYHCACDLSSPIKGLDEVGQIKGALTRNAYLTTLLGYNQEEPFGAIQKFISEREYNQENRLNQEQKTVSKRDLSLLGDVNAFVLLKFANSILLDLHITSPQISRHLAEISFRILGFLYDTPYLTMLKDLSGDRPTILLSAEQLYAMRVFDDENQLPITQWALAIDRYFMAFNNNPDAKFENSFHYHPYIGGYIHNFWTEVIVSKKLQSTALKQIILRTCKLIDNTLKNSRNKDYAFYPAALYAQPCARYFLQDQDELSKAIINGLISTIAEHKNITTFDRASYYQKALKRRALAQDVVLLSEEWWKDFLVSRPL